VPGSVPSRLGARAGSRRLVFLVALLVGAGAVAAFLPPAMTGFLVVAEPVAAADAIYVLGGEQQLRGSKAADLFHQALAPVILLPRQRDRHRDFAIKPAADPAVAEMLRSGIWKPGTQPGEGLHLAWRAPNGRYEVYLYFVENHRSHFRRMELHLESRAAGFLGDLPFGEWRRFGPYDVRVADGVLNLDLLNGGRGDPCLMGLAIVSVNGASRRWYRGVNLAGPAVEINGEPWLSYAEARAQGLMDGDPEKFSPTRRSPTDILAILLVNDGVPPDRIIELPHPGGVRGTADEAAALADYVHAHPMSRILVVTSDFHTRRAQWTLERRLEGFGVDVRMVPVGGVHDVRADGPGAFRRALTEYGKFAGYWGLYHLGLLFSAPSVRAAAARTNP